MIGDEHAKTVYFRHSYLPGAPYAQLGTRTELPSNFMMPLTTPVLYAHDLLPTSTPRAPCDQAARLNRGT